MSQVKAKFPFFKNNPEVVYLDNAATTQKPSQVINRLVDFYEKENASVEGYYKSSVDTTKAYEESRDLVQNFINAKNREEIIFTKGTTDSINFLANILGDDYFKLGDEIITTEMEHHSNFLPWQVLCKKKSMIFKYIPSDQNGDLDLVAYKNLLSEKTKLVAVGHVSNALGTINPVEKIVKMAKEFGALTLVDGAQAVAHLAVDVQKIDCDFYAFSGHKMYGPTGIGVLYGKKECLERLQPYQVGGKMVKEVTTRDCSFADLPYKFEAGTPNVADAIAFGEAVQFVSQNHSSLKQEELVLDYAVKELSKIPNLKIVGNPKKRCSVISFIIDDIHPSDVGMFLAQKGVCIRVGHHCTQPLMKKLGLTGTCRASLAIYNDKNDIDKLVESLKKCIKFFV